MLPNRLQQLKRRHPILQEADGPDLSVTLPDVEYSAETEAFIDALEYKFPPCAGCPK